MTKPDNELDQIGFLLGRAYYSYIGLLQRWLEEAGLAGDIKPGMGSLLFALFRQDDRTISEVAAELQVAKSTMTGMLARMRTAGLIEIHPDANDGRVSRLRLTDRARSLRPRCRQLAQRVEGLLCQGLNSLQQEQFRGMLALTTRTIADELQASGAATIGSQKRHVLRKKVAP